MKKTKWLPIKGTRSMDVSTVKKVIFFDIDGTLVNMEAEIPESTRKALALAQENGHKIIVCTGRSEAQQQDILKTIKFDGYICAAGAYVKYGETVVSKNAIPLSKLGRIISVLEEAGAVYILQCVSFTSTRTGMQEKLDEFLRKKIKVNEEQAGSVMVNMITTDSPSNMLGVEKVVFYESSYSLEKIAEELGKGYDVIDMSFPGAGASCGEISMTGINKAYGMEQLLKFLGKTREDSIAFGDGANDIEMLKYAGIGVAMGNANELAKESSDMVTKGIDEDGIYYALKELNVI